METILIVTRHQGAVEWLARQGINARVISEATADDVRGMDVIGVLPLHLAAEANTVTAIDLPLLKFGQRGNELTADEMDTAGACLRKYVVRRA